MHVIADFLRMREQTFFFDHIERGQRRRDAYGVSAKRRRVRARHPIHHFGLADDNAQRHAGSNALRHANDVRLNTGVLDRPPFPRTANARLHFIRNQQDAVLIADPSQFLHEDGWRNHVSAFALDGLDENRRHFFRREESS